MHDASNKVDPIDRLDPPEKFTALGDRPLGRSTMPTAGGVAGVDSAWAAPPATTIRRVAPKSLIETPARIIIRSLHRTWGRVSVSPVPRYSRRMRLLRAGSS